MKLDLRGWQVGTHRSSFASRRTWRRWSPLMICLMRRGGRVVGVYLRAGSRVLTIYRNEHLVWASQMERRLARTEGP